MSNRASMPGRARRGVAASAAVIAGLTGLTACGESAGPEAGEVTIEDLQALEDDIGALEDRIAGIESDAAGVADQADAGLLGQAEALIGQQVTVSAGVSEVVTTGDVGSAFRIAGDTGEPIAVISANPPANLQVDDTVRISGTVTQIQRDTFEEDFGVSADEIFDDPDAFFETEEGQPALAASSIEVMQEQAQE